MARRYERDNFAAQREHKLKNPFKLAALAIIGTLFLVVTPIFDGANPWILFVVAIFPIGAAAYAVSGLSGHYALEAERKNESERRGGRKVLGMPPKRDAIATALSEAQAKGKKMIDKYLVGFNLENGEPLWVGDDDMCGHACVFAKTGVGKTLWLESLIFQQMARGRASGCTFIDAKRDSGVLAHIILMALITGRIEDLIVVDPFDPVHAYNFVMTNQRADVKARKVLRAGLPPTSDQSTTKHYDRLAADSIYRMVRAMEAMGLAWSIRDIAVALSAFQLAYPQLRKMLHRVGARQAMVELGHLAASYRTAKGVLDTSKITENLRGIASELHSISGAQIGEIFCTRYTDLVVTDAILRGKIIYFMLPRLEEAESAARMVKVFREDLEVAIGEVTSSRQFHLEDPHLVIIDEGSSTFGPTWANLFELARKGRFSLIFGAQSAGGLTDEAMGLSEAFYERVMANVNLKVMMRLGDNRTAMEMTEWIGKVTTTKKAIGAGVMVGRSTNMMRGSLDMQAKMTGGESQNVTLSEDEEDLVSAEELKHEMSAEKGLAWFDLGDGRIVKGRAFWFNAEVPDTWEGREHLVHLEKFENDEVELADWVDEQIFELESRETEAGVRPSKGGNQPQQQPATPPTTEPTVQPQAAAAAGGEPQGAFKLSLSPRGVRGAVSTFAKPAEPSATTTTKEPQKEPPKSPSSPTKGSFLKAIPGKRGPDKR